MHKYQITEADVEAIEEDKDHQGERDVETPLNSIKHEIRNQKIEINNKNDLYYIREAKFVTN